MRRRIKRKKSRITRVPEEIFIDRKKFSEKFGITVPQAFFIKEKLLRNDCTGRIIKRKGKNRKTVLEVEFDTEWLV